LAAGADQVGGAADYLTREEAEIGAVRLLA